MAADFHKKNFTLSRAKAAVLSRDFELASRLYNNLLKEEPNNPDVLHDLAAMYTRSGQDNKALSVYEQILIEDEKNFDALTSLGGIYRRLNRFEDSIAVLERALAIEPNDVQVYYNLGFTYKLMGIFQDALECFNTAISLSPNDILAYNQQGSIYSLLGDSKSAIASYGIGLQLDPNHPVLHLNLAKEFEKLGRDDEAKIEYETTLRVKPGWPDAMNGYALFLMDRDKNSEAYDLLLQGISVAPEDIELQYSMGSLQVKRNEYEDAETRFQRVLSKNAFHQNALFSLLDIYSKDNKPEKADALFNKIKNFPSKIEINQIRYAKSLLNANRIKEAGILIKKLWDENNSSIEILTLVAEYFVCTNDLGRLKPCLRRFQLLKPNYTKHYLDIAERFRQIGNMDEARHYLEKYLEYHPEDMVALISLASCYEFLEAFGDALNLYEKALSIDKKNVYLKTAVKRTSKNNTARINPLDVPEVKTSEPVSDLSTDSKKVSSEEINLNDVNPEVLQTEVLLEPESQSDEEIFFDLDKIDSAFSKREDVYDPLELEPLDLDLSDEGNSNLDSLAFDGGPMDYDPISTKKPFDDEDYDDSSNDANRISFDDEELELPACDDLEAKKELEKSFSINPKLEQSHSDSLEMPIDKSSPVKEEKTLQTEPYPVETLEMQEIEPVKVLSNIVATDVLHRIPEILNNLMDNKIAQRCDSAAELFRHMKNMCDYLPPLQKEAFLSGKKHVQIDYIIDRLTGRPGLLATAEELRRNGLVQIPEARYDIVEKFDEAATTGRVLSLMRAFIHHLPEKNIAIALDNAVIDVLERLAIKNLYEPE